MKRFFIPAIIILLICACHSKPSELPVVTIKQPDTAKKNYLPVADYLLSEIAAVDSFPLKIMKYRIINGKTTDSAIITAAEFDGIAAKFMNPAITDTRMFERNFDENSFIDRTTNKVNFTYSAKKPGYGLNRVDVLVSPAGGVDKLSSIYMESMEGNQNFTTINKLSWKAGRSFRILDITRYKSDPETTSQTVVVWDTRD